MSAGGVEVLCDELTFRYEEAGAELRFDCTFAEGEITALLGPSGSGKSTLLNLVAGFELAEKGRILFGEQDCTRSPPSERPVSMIFQENNLFAHMRVSDNVGLGISPKLRLTGPDREAIEDALRSVNLGGYGARKPAELSGGERQRVALARAMLRDRPVLLLDEAFASLGPALRSEMLELVSGIQRERAMTTIMVTHSPEDARRIASEVVFLEGGTVAAKGRTAEILDSRHGPDAVRAYLGAVSSDTA